MEVWVHYSYDVKEQPRSDCYFKKRNQTALDVFPPPYTPNTLCLLKRQR